MSESHPYQTPVEPCPQCAERQKKVEALGDEIRYHHVLNRIAVLLTLKFSLVMTTLVALLAVGFVHLSEIASKAGPTTFVVAGFAVLVCAAISAVIVFGILIDGVNCDAFAQREIAQKLGDSK